ncbi:MAG: hypothetical protein HYU69_07300, partial [Bacteroidetes bacterium]|nr:hypothetical protein [Bacteroidota bacterium]
MKNDIKTKANYMCLFLLIICSIFFITTSDAKGNEEQVRQWMQNQPVKFLENKGQMADMNGDPIPFVLFKAEAPGLDMYVTEKGLTYVFIKNKEESEKDEREEGANVLPDRENNESAEVEWNRVDMTLKGASIKKENIMKEGMSGWVKNYYLSNCTDGIRDVHAYEKITIKNI